MRRPALVSAMAIIAMALMIVTMSEDGTEDGGVPVLSSAPGVEEQALESLRPDLGQTVDRVQLDKKQVDERFDTQELAVVEKAAPTRDIVESHPDPMIRIGGIVLNTLGSPIANSEVEAYLKLKGKVSDRIYTRYKTQSDGEFVLLIGGGASFDKILIAASKSGFQSAFLEHPRSQIERSGSKLMLMLTKGSSISGTVVDVSGVPLHNANVTVRPSNLYAIPASKHLVTKTSEDGSFELEGIPRGTAAVVVTPSESYVPSVFRKEIYQDGHNDLGVMVIDEKFDVEGVVLNPDGNPVSNANVSLDLPMQSLMKGHGLADVFGAMARGSIMFKSIRKHMEAVVTGTDGRFIFRLLPDLPFTFRSSNATYGASSTEISGLPLREPLIIQY